MLLELMKILICMEATMEEDLVVLISGLEEAALLQL